MYEYRPSSFKILPDVVKNLLIINGLFFLATFALQGFGINLIKMLGLYYVGSEYFRPYQFITHMFMHGGFLHIFSNMFALWMFGSRLENVWGPKRFLFFYFFTGLGAALIHSGVTYWEVHHLQNSLTQFSSPQEIAYVKQVENIPTVGASGAVFGVLVAFGMLFPNTQLLLLFPPIPIKAKYFVFFYAAFELYAGISSIHGGSNIAHFAHIGGALFGFILVKYWNRRSRNFF